MPKTKLPPKEFVWTPELAYMVGLLATDGNLSKDGRHIIMRSSDIDLLRTFKACLNLKNKICQTYTIGKIKIPKDYFRDFLRGHLDGDGSIFTYRDQYNMYKGKQYINTRIYTRFISASEKHIQWLHAMIKKCSPVQGALLSRPPTANSVRMWEVEIAKYESLPLKEKGLSHSIY